MQVPTGTVRRVVLLCAGALLVAACADDPPEAGHVPTETPTPPSVTTSASGTPATSEAAGQQMENTVREYFAATNAAFKSGRVRALKSFSTKSCPCRRAAEEIAEVTSSGGRFESLAYRLEMVRAHGVQGDVGLVEVRASLAPYTVYDGRGKITEKSAGGELHTDFSLIKSDGRWIIANAVNL